jgi:hypothetical protein
MAVSAALRDSAEKFCLKYACRFDFVTFESSVEEFTFLRPNNGWREAYKEIFDQVYRQALRSAAEGRNTDLDAEAMLDDFEYTLIRPYVNECEEQINHKPYVGMDRITRLEYLEHLTKRAPSNLVALYTEKYKNGELTGAQMRTLAALHSSTGAMDVEIAGYVQALENVNSSRSFIWRLIHPFKNSAEKRDAAHIKRMLVSDNADECYYNAIALEAYETFDGHIRAKFNLRQNMARAKDEMRQKKKMNDAIRESFNGENRAV